MRLLDALCSGIRGCENGTAEIYVRGQEGTFAQLFDDFDGSGARTPTAGVQLDANGGAVVFVNQPVTVFAKSVDGATVRQFSAYETATAVEVRSQSFTGVDYETGQSAAGNPVLLSTVLDLLKTSTGTTDFNVLVAGVAKSLSAAIGAVASLFINVKDATYAGGAVGNGIVDDTAAMNAAIAAANAAGAVLFLPAGNYKVTAVLTTINGAAGLLGYGATVTQTVNANVFNVAGGLNGLFQAIGISVALGTGAVVQGFNLSTTVSTIFSGVTITTSSTGAGQRGINSSSSGTQTVIGSSITSGGTPIAFSAGTVVASASQLVNTGTSCNGINGSAAAAAASAQGCTFSSTLGGSQPYLNMPAAGRLFASANVFNAPSGGGTCYAMWGNFTTLDVFIGELGNICRSGVTPTLISNTIPADATGQFPLFLSRDTRRFYDVDGASPIQFGTTDGAVLHLRRTAGGAVTVNLERVAMGVNCRCLVVLENDSGVGITFTFPAAPTVFAGLVAGASPTVAAARVRVLVFQFFVVNAINYMCLAYDSGDIAGI